MASRDPDRIPVVIAAGQSLERDALVTPMDLIVRAAEAALSHVPALRQAIERVSVVRPLGHAGPAPASQLATHLGLASPECEVSTIGGNTPQWLVNRAASAIAAGDLSATLIVGAEALRSSRARRAAGEPRRSAEPDLPADPVVGDDRSGLGPAEGAIGLILPVHIYPMLESAIAAAAGHDGARHRQAMGALLAPFTEVAAANPFAWFPERYSAEAIATPSPDNRVVAEPYTKRMAAFLGSDQGAALIVCSLAAAEKAGVSDRAVFVWAGAEANDVYFPASRPEPGRSPAIAAAGRALFAAAGAAAGPDGSVDIDDLGLIDLYSCFPSAVEAAADALGLAADDRRGLTVTGGLPYFGGPGNNYTTHAVATLTDRLRDESAGDGHRPRFGLATGLGWFITKHALGLYATEPPPGGFRRGDTAAAQEAIDATATPMALEVEEPTAAVVVAATVVRGGDGTEGIGPATAAPAIVRLPDGRQMAVSPIDEHVLDEVGGRDVPGLVGTDLLVQPGPPRYRLP
jgi:acetyl-CoA C-acetyltransferase